jgi:peptidoglycan/xylan/chitin deacetylase (PgdA/CDA1 family)
MSERRRSALLRWVAVVGVTLHCFAGPPTLAQEVAITMDDLPSHGPLPIGTTRTDVAKSVLATLRVAKVPSVYGFINAGKLEKNPEDIEVLRLWREAGQPLGNHTYTHIKFNDNTAAAFEENVEKNEPTLKLLMGEKDWHWFRYPYLWEGETLEKRHEVRAYLKAHGYRIAQVTLDFEDYAWNGAYARCADKKDEKAITCLIVIFLNTGAEYIALDQKMAQQLFRREINLLMLLLIVAFDALMLPQLLEQLNKQGFKFVTLEEAESDPAYLTDPDAALKDGGTLLDQVFDSKHLQYPPHAEKPMKELSEVCR